MTEGRKLLLSQNEKRQSTAALQNASRVRGRVVSPLSKINHSLRELLARKPGVTIAHQAENSEIGEVARSLESGTVQGSEGGDEQGDSGHGSPR